MAIGSNTKVTIRKLFMNSNVEIQNVTRNTDLDEMHIFNLTNKLQSRLPRTIQDI